MSEPTQKWIADFVGRRVHAIGRSSRIQTEVSGPTPEDARLKLYERYEHIADLHLTPAAGPAAGNLRRQANRSRGTKRTSRRSRRGKGR